MRLLSRETAVKEPPVLVGTEDTETGVALTVERGDVKVVVGVLQSEGEFVLNNGAPEELTGLGFKVTDSGMITCKASDLE